MGITDWMIYGRNQVSRKVWILYPSLGTMVLMRFTQAKVYEYAAFLDEEFKALWEEAKDLRDVSLLRNVATGVIHK